jgi:hypothetical protein
MRATDDSNSFYANVPIFTNFGNVVEQASYVRLPDDWTIGVSDIVQSTKAIRESRYRVREHGRRCRDRCGQECAGRS